ERDDGVAAIAKLGQARAQDVLTDEERGLPEMLVLQRHAMEAEDEQAIAAPARAADERRGADTASDVEDAVLGEADEAHASSSPPEFSTDATGALNDPRRPIGPA